MATIDRFRVTKIGDLGCPNHGGELCLCLKSLDMILNRGDVLGFQCLSSRGARYVDAAAKPQESLEFFSMVTQVETHVGKLGMGNGGCWRRVYFLRGYISFLPKYKLCYRERGS